MFYFRTVQEAGTTCPEKISSISGANKKRPRLDLELEVEQKTESSDSSDEDEEEEHKEAIENTVTDSFTFRKLEECVKKPLNSDQTLPSTPAHQKASHKPLSKPAVFIPVDRSPEIQVSLHSGSS